MNNQNNLQLIKNTGRKKFFTKLSKGFMGLVVLGSFPFNLFGNSPSKRVEIKINPLAVKRKNGNKKNG